MQKWLLRLGVRFLRKPKFRTWAVLEDIKFQIIEAVEQASEGLPHLIDEYINTASIIHPTNYNTVYWKDEIDAFLSVHRVTVPKKVLPLVSRPSKGKNDKDVWDYSGRLWFYYSGIIAQAYGWTVKQIAKLHVDDALAYIQEILTDKHLEREFVHSMSETAYEYNKNTKKSKYVPLEKPYWMLPDITKVSKKKIPAIPKSLLPVGTAIKLKDRINETQETKPK